MEQITAPNVATAPFMDRHPPLLKRNDPRTIIPLRPFVRGALVKYTTSGGKEVFSSGTILDPCGLEIICAIVGALSVVAWDTLRLVELEGG
jgi:hypothetical protein